MVCLSDSLNQPEPPQIMHTIELNLTTTEYRRAKLIAAVMKTTVGEVYRNELNEMIENGLFDEMLTGHDCPWVG